MTPTKNFNPEKSQDQNKYNDHFIYSDSSQYELESLMRKNEITNMLFDQMKLEIDSLRKDNLTLSRLIIAQNDVITKAYDLLFKFLGLKD